MSDAHRSFLIPLLSSIACCLLSHPGTAGARDTVEKQGDILAIAIPAIGLGSTLFYEEGYDGTIQFLKSYATSAATTQVLKYVTKEERPNGSCCKSFPSGHTSSAFMGASFIHERYGLEYAIPAYIGATYVGYTRVHTENHYTHDVLAGAAVGILSSFYFTEPYKGFNVSESISSDGFEINITARW